MQFQSIRIKELMAFVESKAFESLGVIPITKHRAYSHIQNPRAEAEDVVLVLVYEEQELVAYLGVFPDALHFGQQVERCGWLSCMWVNPKMRGRGIAKKLLQAVFEAWDYRILVTEFTPAAKGLYDRTEQFIDLAQPIGLRGYLRPNFAHILPKRSPRLKGWRPALKVLDGLLSLPNRLRLAFWSSNCPTIRYLDAIDDEAWDFVQSFKSDELLRRSKEDLQWLARHPWLLSTPLMDDYAPRYHFSARSERFHFWNIKVYDEAGKMAAFLILSYRDGHLKVPYAYYRSDAIELAARTITAHLLKSKAKMLSIYQWALLKHFKSKRGPFFWKRQQQRHYIISKVFAEQLKKHPDFRIQDGDADAAFT